jgi:hypothetical protein
MASLGCGPRPNTVATSAAAPSMSAGVITSGFHVTPRGCRRPPHEARD